MMAEKEVPKYLVFDNFQSYAGLAYTVDPSSFGILPGVPMKPSGENYQQSFSSSYGRGYGSPAPYHPKHLKVTGNPDYQTGPPGHKMSHDFLALTPASRGFMPVTIAAVQRPGMAPTQPSSPTQPAQVQPAITPAMPLLTMQTFDTSNGPEALGGSCANPAKKREIEDNSREIGALFARLNSGDISKNAAEMLVQLCQLLDNGDFSTALQIQVQRMASDWDEYNFWLATLKQLLG